MKKPKKPKKRAAAFKPRKIKIKVIGLGGGGSSIVCEMARGMKGVSFTAADTDSRVFKIAGGRRGVKVFQFGQKVLGGRGSGMNWELAKKAAEEEKEKIARLFSDVDFAVLVGCLGGGVASGAGPVFARLAGESRGTVPVGIFTLPFAFEGEKKMQLAKKAAEEIRQGLAGIVVIPNERIFSIIDKKTPLQLALSTLNQMFVKWLAGLIEVVSKPGLINIDFADIRTILKGRGEVIYFAEVEAGGPNRAEEICQKIFKNPLFEKENLLAKRILFNIKGGRDLSLMQTAQISEGVSRLNPKAKIIFGLSEEPSWKNKIGITLLAVGEEKQPAKKIKRRPRPKPKLEAKAEEKQNSRQPVVKIQPVKKRKTNKKTRRNALEIKKEAEKSSHEEWHNEEEGEWQLPAYLRMKN